MKTNAMTGPNFFLYGLTLVLITLKLLGEVSMSWWWVFSPLWIPIVVGLVLVILYALLSDYVLGKGDE